METIGNELTKLERQEREKREKQELKTLRERYIKKSLFRDILVEAAKKI